MVGATIRNQDLGRPVDFSTFPQLVLKKEKEPKRKKPRRRTYSPLASSSPLLLPIRGVRFSAYVSYAPPGLMLLRFQVPGLPAGATVYRPSGPNSFTASMTADRRYSQPVLR